MAQSSPNDFKSMRPFVWLKLPGLPTGDVSTGSNGTQAETLEFHLAPDDSFDRRFSYLIDFEIEQGDGSSAKFTIVDYQYKMFKLMTTLEKNLKKVLKLGAVETKELKEKFRAIWQWGWTISDRTENPWRNIGHRGYGGKPDWRIRDWSPPMSGYVRSISLDVSEGIYKYEVEVGSAVQFTQRFFIPELNTGGLETKFKAKNAKELIEQILDRADLTVSFSKEAEGIVKASKLTCDYEVGKKTIGACINDILKRYCRVSKDKKAALIVVSNTAYRKDTNLPDFFVELRYSKKRSKPIRSYNVGINPDNLVINFSPTIDKLWHRTLSIRSPGVNADGTKSICKQGESKLKKGQIISHGGPEDSQGERGSYLSIRDKARQAAKQTHRMEKLFAGLTGELTIVGDPGLIYRIGRAPGWDRASGRTVLLNVRRFPYLEGDWGNIKWQDSGIDPVLSGPYTITRVSHSLGASRPYETTISLSKRGDDDLNYKDISESEIPETEPGGW